jgi:hypothetical protein
MRFWLRMSAAAVLALGGVFALWLASSPSAHYNTPEQLSALAELESEPSPENLAAWSNQRVRGARRKTALIAIGGLSLVAGIWLASTSRRARRAKT